MVSYENGLHDTTLRHTLPSAANSQSIVWFTIGHGFLDLKLSSIPSRFLSFQGPFISVHTISYPNLFPSAAALWFVKMVQAELTLPGKKRAASGPEQKENATSDTRKRGYSYSPSPRISRISRRVFENDAKLLTPVEEKVIMSTLVIAYIHDGHPAEDRFHILP